ncbi:TonB-dependent receptor domain-containing protein [Larkinella soli]|uniref:TonB-dependent receptor domain-containing protein n=1 Tax=Larkinella soli TaxID=1770527 RepID=UPI000FFC8ED0|nr:TonB-dependent receptor [Larkinella soli]
MKTVVCRLFALFLLCTLRLDAQPVAPTGSVRGVVVDSVSGRPLPFITIALIRRGKAVDGTLTDSLGRFSLQKLPFDTYTLTFSAVGFRTTQIPAWVLDARQPDVETDTVGLVQEARTLQAVTVRAQRPLIEQRADGITFNVESLPSMAGSDASDVLRKVPLLAVDASGGLSLRGSANIRVFIDGKPSDLYASSVADALKAIPGESIVRVEVITHPSARYDAEGTDGVVNIITRRSRANTTNGNVSGMLGNRSHQLMGDLQTKYDQWLIKLDGIYQTYWNRNGSVLERTSAGSAVRQRNESRQTGRYGFGGTSILYSIDSLNTLTAVYRFRHLLNRTTLQSENFQTDGAGGLRPAFDRQVVQPSERTGHQVSGGYTGFSRDKQREFSLLGTYSHSPALSRYALEQTEPVFYQETFESRSVNRDWIVQADYARTLRDNRKWETGGKITQKAIDSESRFEVPAPGPTGFQPDPVRSNVFSYRSRIYALYLNYNFRLGRWQFITGTRYELTALQATFKQEALRIPSYRNLAPNLLISRSLNLKSTLKVGYTVRLVRPFYGYLDPTVNNSDSLNVQFGNPRLLPEVTRRYQVSYSQNGTRLFTEVALFLNQNRNSIQAVRTPRPDGVFESTWQNVGQNRRLGASVTLTWKPTAGINLNGTVTTQYVRFESPAMGLSNRGWMRQLVLNYSHKLPKGFSVDFYGFFDSDNLFLQGRRTGWKYYSLTVSRKTAGDRFTMSLRLDTILTPFTYLTEATTAGAFRQQLTYRYQNQNIRLTLSYKLGKKEIKSPRMRQTESPE